MRKKYISRMNSDPISLAADGDPIIEHRLARNSTIERLRNGLSESASRRPFDTQRCCSASAETPMRR